MFIKLGERILDFDKYRRHVSLLKRYAASDVEALFAVQGFQVVKRDSRKSYSSLLLELYNPDLMLKITLTIEKVGPDELEE